MGTSTDLTGHRFGRLVVTKKTGVNKYRQTTWLCQCDCGNTTEVMRSSLTGYLRGIKGQGTGSCGCLKTDHVKSITLPPGRAAFNRVVAGYKKAAKARGYDWAISDDHAHSLTQKSCAYCGSEPNNVYKYIRAKDKPATDFVYNGIDRVDNSKGYTVKNTVACCKLCNMMKRNLTKSDFLNHIKRIAKYQEG